MLLYICYTFDDIKIEYVTNAATLFIHVISGRNFKSKRLTILICCLQHDSKKWLIVPSWVLWRQRYIFWTLLLYVIYFSSLVINLFKNSSILFRFNSDSQMKIRSIKFFSVKCGIWTSSFFAYPALRPKTVLWFMLQLLTWQFSSIFLEDFIIFQ